MERNTSNISGLAEGMAMGVRFAGLMVKDGIRDNDMEKVTNFMMILGYVIHYLPKNDDLHNIYEAGKKFSNFKGIYDDE